MKKVIRILFANMQKTDALQKGTAVILCAVCLMCSGCRTEETISLPLPRWILVGLVDAETGALKVLEPKNKNDCYTLWFETEDTISIIGINSKMKLSLLNLTPKTIFEDSEMCEKYKNGIYYCDSDLFYRSIATTGSYSATDTELMLFQHYCNKTGDIQGVHQFCLELGEIKSYLLFKQIDFQ